MIQILNNEDNGKVLKMSGDIKELTAECVMIMRELYKRNLELFPEPEIAGGIMANMLVKALDLYKVLEKEKIDEEIVLTNELSEQEKGNNV